jgi:hypothetical protein
MAGLQSTSVADPVGETQPKSVEAKLIFPCTMLQICIWISLTAPQLKVAEELLQELVLSFEVNAVGFQGPTCNVLLLMKWLQLQTAGDLILSVLMASPQQESNP